MQNDAPLYFALLFLALVGASGAWSLYVRVLRQRLRERRARPQPMPRLTAPQVATLPPPAPRPAPPRATLVMQPDGNINRERIALVAPPAPTTPAPTNTSTADLLAASFDALQSMALFVPPGGGKTVLQNTLLLKALRDGVRVVVLNPHFSYYHPDEQPIDLRSLRGLFEVASDVAVIVATLRRLLDLMESRKPALERGESLGESVLALIDEWPVIAENEDRSDVAKPGGRDTYTHGELARQYLRRLLREARKFRIYVVLASQDGQVETLGLSGGVRSAFTTRICGRGTDITTWQALLGKATPYEPPKDAGTFVVGGPVAAGMFRCTMPDAAMIEQARQSAAALLPAAPAETPPAPPSAPEQAEPCADTPADADPLYSPPSDAERDAAALWAMDILVSTGTMPSRRALARWLYAERGGPRANYDGGGSFNIVARPLYDDILHTLQN